MKDFTAERASEYRKAAAACALLQSEAEKPGASVEVQSRAARAVTELAGRAARIEAMGEVVPSAAPPAPIEAIAPALTPISPSKPAAKPAPRLAGTREDRLKHLARAMGADHRLLAQAIASGESPDDFALEILDSRDPEAIAARIIASDRLVPSRVDADAEAVAQRVLAA